MEFFETYPSDDYNLANRVRYTTLIDSADAHFQNKIPANNEVVKFSGIDESMPFPMLTYSYNADALQKIKGSLQIASLSIKAKMSINDLAYFDSAEYRFSIFTLNESTSLELTKAELHGLDIKATSHYFTITDNYVTKRLCLTNIDNKTESYQNISPKNDELIQEMIEYLELEDVFELAKINNGLLSDEKVNSLINSLSLKYQNHKNRDNIYEILSKSKKRYTISKEISSYSSLLSQPSVDDLEDLIFKLRNLK